MGSPNIFDVLISGRERKNLAATRSHLSVAEQQTALLRRQVELLQYIAETLHRIETREHSPM